VDFGLPTLKLQARMMIDPKSTMRVLRMLMTVSGGTLNPTHSLTRNFLDA